MRTRIRVLLERKKTSRTLVADFLISHGAIAQLLTRVDFIADGRNAGNITARNTNLGITIQVNTATIHLQSLKNIAAGNPDTGRSNWPRRKRDGHESASPFLIRFTLNSLPD